MKARRRPLAAAVESIEMIPGVWRTTPSSDSSPATRASSSWSTEMTWPLARRMPRAMGRSYVGPAFFRSAGARLTVTRPNGNLPPELRMAARTRSWLSRTAASGSPTTTVPGTPCPTSTSTSTSTPSNPTTAHELTFASTVSLLPPTVLVTAPSVRDPTRCTRSVRQSFLESGEDSIGCKGYGAQAHPDRIEDGVANGRRHRADRGLAGPPHRLVWPVDEHDL